MNKYQEALMEVEEIAYKQYEDACYNKTTKARAMEYERKLKDDTKILQELVDKETPMKPKKNDITNHDQFSDLCPICKMTLLYKGSGCQNNDCRQKIDWSLD